MKKVIRKQVYTIEVDQHGDGSFTLHRTNDGFSTAELIGLLTITRRELMKSFEEPVQIERVKRTVIED